MTFIGGMRPTDLPKELRSCWLLLWGRSSLTWKAFSLPLLLRSLSEFKCCKCNIDKRRFHLSQFCSVHRKQLWVFLLGPTSVMAVRLLAKLCPSDNSAYFPSKDASFSLSCRHQGSVNAMQNFSISTQRLLLPSAAWRANCFSLSGSSLFLAEPVKLSERTVSSVLQAFPETTTTEHGQCWYMTAHTALKQMPPCLQMSFNVRSKRVTPLSACCQWFTQYQRSQKFFKNQFGNHSTLHMAISAGLYDRYFCTAPCVWQQGADTQRSPLVPPDSDSSFHLLDWFLLPASETPNSPNLWSAAQSPDKAAHTQTVISFDDELLQLENPTHVPGATKTAVTKNRKTHMVAIWGPS